VTDRGMASEFDAPNQRLRPPSGERAIEPEVGEHSGATRLDRHLSLRPDPRPDEVSHEGLMEAECEAKMRNRVTIGERGRRLGENLEAREWKDVAGSLDWG